MAQVLTVLIPTKERSAMLAALLKKLESENPAVVRVVVSDNCSEDPGYASVIPQACASHPLQVTYKRHETPVSGLQNFESLLPFATTMFTCFLADDDYWEEGALTRIAQRMNESRLDFAYAQEWCLHDRKTDVALERYSMHALHEDRVRNVQAFIRYRNDPHVYGIFRSPLLLEMCTYFTPGWWLLPRSHLFDTAFNALVFVYLSTSRIEWMPYVHSQGVARPSPAAPALSGPKPGLVHRLALVETAHHLARRLQLYALFLRTMSRMGCSLSDRARVLFTCARWFFVDLPVSAVIGDALRKRALKLRN